MARDLLSIRNVRQWRARADIPSGYVVRGPEKNAILAAGVADRLSATRGFVALIDGELCAYLIVGRHDIPYRWDVIALGVGSPRLDASDDVSVELWVALLEYAIKDIGALGARRLYASAVEGSTLFEGLRQAGFSSYTRVSFLRGHPSQLPDRAPTGFRAQQASDVWSIHQLYHRSTPPVVQFSEALTSDEWELPEHSWRDRLSLRRHTPYGFVLETAEGVGGYCRVVRRGSTVMVSLLTNMAYRPAAVDLVSASVTAAGVDETDELNLVIPAYFQEAVSSFEAYGLRVETELISMVRHTTAPMVVHPDLRPATAAAEAKQPARGVLTGARRTM